MKNNQKISKTEVKRYFLLANAFKNPAKRKKELGINGLRHEYQKLKEYFLNLKESELDEKFSDKVRLKRYNSMDWYKSEIELEKAGVWPKMKGLDIKLTVGNVPVTTEGVKKILNGKLNLEVPKKFLIQLSSLREIAEFVYENFPLVFYPGGEVREKDYNVWARENNQPLCNIYDFDIDDGCSRAIAYWLNGVKKAPTFFAEYKT